MNLVALAFLVACVLATVQAVITTESEQLSRRAVALASKIRRDYQLGAVQHDGYHLYCGYFY